MKAWMPSSTSASRNGPAADRNKNNEIAGETMGPLSGLKVVDLTHVMAGPTCTLMLADMGDAVLKSKKLPAGDDARYMGPPRIGDGAASFLMMNRNKKGIALDLKTPGGAKVLRRLIEKADVLVENFGPGVMDRLGFGYTDISKAHPALIYCSLSGFGRTGPYKLRAVYMPDAARAVSGIPRADPWGRVIPRF